MLEGSDWVEHYKPVDLAGKVVLDLGAGEGESARFFLEHGARKVICIEADPKAYENLAKNAQKFPNQLTAIYGYFNLGHLDLEYDFLKCDIEGYEEVLLDVELKTPSVIEVHGLQLKDKFQAKGYRIDKNFNMAGYITYAYWNC